jgi:phosphoglucomutase
LLDVLEEIYAKHGFYLDALDNFVFKGVDGPEKISQLVNGLRNNPPKNAGDVEVLEMEDYKSEKMLSLGFPSSNVLRFILADGSWVAVRPSGTEPLIRVMVEGIDTKKTNAIASEVAEVIKKRLQ